MDTQVRRTPEEDRELLALERETGCSVWNILKPEGKEASERFDALPEAERQKKIARLTELRAKTGKTALDLLGEE